VRPELSPVSSATCRPRCREQSSPFALGAGGAMPCCPMPRRAVPCRANSIDFATLRFALTRSNVLRFG
jgi:hypothetical protein